MRRKTAAITSFARQNSDDSPERLAEGEFVSLQNVFLDKGEANGDKVGTALHKTDFSSPPLVIHHFKSSDGGEYVLTWNENGSISYYCATTSFDQGWVVNNLITDIFYPPCFVNWGNEYIIVLGGKDGNFKITSSAYGELSATPITTIPPARLGFVDNGCLYIAQDTSLLHSAPGAPERWTPTNDELSAIPPIYSLNYRVNLAESGVLGEAIAACSWKGIKFLWTQYDLFVLLWDGMGEAWPSKLPGYGIKGPNSYEIFDDRIVFFSPFKGGALCEVVMGSAGGLGETFSIGQGVTITILEHQGAKKVSDVFRACPNGTMATKTIAIDSKTDWESPSKIANKAGFNTEARPGWIFLDGSALVDRTTVNTNYNYTSPSTWIIPGRLSEYFDNYAVLTGDVRADLDGAPGTQPATSPTPTYTTISFKGKKMGRPDSSGSQKWVKSIQTIRQGIYYYDENGRRQPFVDKSRQSAVLVPNSGWQKYEPLAAVNTNYIEIWIEFALRLSQKNALEETTITQVVSIQKSYVLPNRMKISKLYFYGATLFSSGDPLIDGITFGLTIGEINIYGADVSGQGVITSAVIPVEGLIPSSTDSLGTFFVAYEGYGANGDEGLTGSNPTGVEIGLSKNGTDWTPPNGATAILTQEELKSGYKLKNLGVNTTSEGEIYTRVRIPMTLDATGRSPSIDKILWDFYTGEPKKSLFPVFSWRDKVIVSLMDKDSTECDRAVVVNEGGGCSVMKGTHWLAGKNLGEYCLVTQKNMLGKLGEGAENPILAHGEGWKNVPLEKVIVTKPYFGLFKTHLRRLMAGIIKYIPDETSIGQTVVDVKDFVGGYGCGQIALNGKTGRAYASDWERQKVVVIDTKSKVEVTTITDLPDPKYIAVNTITNKIYVSNPDDYSISVIDGQTNEVETIISMPGVDTSPMRLSVNEMTNKLYALNSSGGSDSVVVVDCSDNSTTLINTGKLSPMYPAIDPSRGRLYIGNSVDEYLTILDLADNSITNVDIGAVCETIAVNKTTNRIYIGTSEGSVVVVDGETLEVSVIDLSSYGNTVSSVAVNETTNKVFATVYFESANGYMMEIDGTDNSVDNAKTTRKYPMLAVVNEMADVVYFITKNISWFEMSKYDVATGTIGLLESQNVYEPFALAYDPDNQVLALATMRAETEQNIRLYWMGDIVLRRNWEGEDDVTSFQLFSNQDLTSYDALRFTVNIDDWKTPSVKNETVRWDLKLTLTDLGNNVYTYRIPTAGLKRFGPNSPVTMLVDISGIDARDTITGEVSAYGETAADSYKLTFTLGAGRTKDIIYGVQGALEIYGVADGKETLIHRQAEAIDGLTFIPPNTPAPRNIQGRAVQAKIKTKGRIRLTGVVMEYDEAEGRRGQ